MKKTAYVLALLLALALPVRADFVQTFNSGFANGGNIPDGAPTGWTDTRIITGAPDGIASLSVTLNLTGQGPGGSGGFNGDLYAYLVHGSSGFAVLLNRVGVGTGSSPVYDVGFSASGMNVVFSDGGAGGNIHQVGLPTSGGIYAPDGRNILPSSSPSLFSVTSPSAFLSSFNGLNANGSWTLFIADMSGGGGLTQITSWGLDIVPTPEPASLVEGAVALLFLGCVVSVYRLKGPKDQPLPC